MCASARKLENLIRCVLLALCTSCGFLLSDLRGYSTSGEQKSWSNLNCLKPVYNIQRPPRAWQIENYTFCGFILGISLVWPPPHTHTHTQTSMHSYFSNDTRQVWMLKQQTAGVINLVGWQFAIQILWYVTWCFALCHK